MPDRQRLFRRLLPIVERRQTGLLVLILIGFGSLFGAMLYELRGNAWRQAMTASDNLLGSISRELGRDIVSLERALEMMRMERESETGPRVTFPAIAAVLSGSAEFLLLDRDGQITVRSGTEPEGSASAEAAEIMADLRSTSTGRLYVGPPMRGSDDVLRLWLALPVRAPSGGVDGAVAATIRLDRWRQVFEHFDIGAMSSINLFHASGRLTMRAPFENSRIGADFSHTANFQRFAAETSGRFVATAVIDGVERAYTFTRIGGHPLLLNVAFSTREIFAAFNRSAIVVGAAFVLLVALLGGLAHLLMRELRLRRTSEARYRALSGTDGLTGIANRRSFDLGLEREWGRAARERSALSMILIDVDHFKAFNDLYGHPAGDLCLTRVATAIAGAVKRPADLVARYGGEEFAVLLPNTDEAAALVLAEQIRLLVASLAIAHTGSRDNGSVTVSLGVAMAHPASDLALNRPSALLDAADRALYVAKRDGRNRVAAGSPASEPGSSTERAQESERLAVLTRYETILDEAMTESLSELATMAAAVFHAPLALVTLIDHDNGVLRFVGRHGTALEGARIEGSFCRQTIRGEGLFVVTDPTSDPRFARHPFVVGEPNLRFYAGVPLRIDGDGPAIGSVCVMDTATRETATPMQAGVLKDLARAVMKRLEERLREEARSLPAALRQASGR